VKLAAILLGVAAVLTLYVALRPSIGTRPWRNR